MSTQQQHSRVKEILQNILVMLISLFIAVAIGEVVLRVLRPSPVGGVVADPILGFRADNIPDFDANGWHNASVLTHAEIVALGDSMTQGQGVELRDDAWPQVLSRVASTSVYQMALGGYGPVQYAYLAKHAKELQPKVLVVGFYFGNDLYDAQHLVYNFDAWKELRDPKFHATIDTKVDVADLSTRNAVLAGAPKGSFMYYMFITRLWVRGHSRVYALLGDSTRILREKLGLAHTESEKNVLITKMSGDDPSVAYVYDKDDRITTILSPSYRLDAVDLENEDTKEGWRIAQERFGEMKEVMGTSTTLVIVEIPTKEAVYLDLMMRREGKIPEQFNQYKQKEDFLEKTFLNFCEAERIHCFSLRAAMLAKLESGVPVYKRVMDGHLPKEGYQTVAEAIGKYLLDNGLIRK